jgi:hypothetical protein
MKRLLLLTLALSLPLAQMVRAENDNDKKKHKRQAEAAAENRSQQASQPVTGVARRPVQQEGRRNIAPTQRTVTRAPRSVAPSVHRQPVKSEAQTNGRDRQRTQVANQVNTGNGSVKRGRNNSQVSVQRSGGNRNFNRNSFAVAQSRVVRTRHDRGWWNSHYRNCRFVLFGGGYYFWNAGYWYPAYGYSPYYNNYLYSEPIYGYNNLDPGRVLQNVQLALRDQGYYPGAIDGSVGPQTRSALAAFQRDHGLVVTAAVDEPTLVTLGLA